MRKYVGSGDYVSNVPARDLTEEEWAEHVAAERIVETVEITDDEGKVKRVPGPAMALWQKAPDPPTEGEPDDAPARSGRRRGGDS